MVKRKPSALHWVTIETTKKPLSSLHYVLVFFDNFLFLLSICTQRFSHKGAVLLTVVVGLKKETSVLCVRVKGDGEPSLHLRYVTRFQIYSQKRRSSSDQNVLGLRRHLSVFVL